MVRAEDVNMDRLRRLFAQMKAGGIRIADCQGDLEDVVAEMFTMDTFIAGVASTLLDGKAVEEAHREILAAPIFEGTAWILPEGGRNDLSGHPGLLGYAHLLDEVRKECLELLRSRDGRQAKLAAERGEKGP